MGLEGAVFLEVGSFVPVAGAVADRVAVPAAWPFARAASEAWFPRLVESGWVDRFLRRRHRASRVDSFLFDSRLARPRCLLDLDRLKDRCCRMVAHFRIHRSSRAGAVRRFEICRCLVRPGHGCHSRLRLLTVLAVMSSCSDWTDVAEFFGAWPILGQAELAGVSLPPAVDRWVEL